MANWGTALGSGYDAFFDRKDKNREFELRKQQEEALNTLRQIQIQAALENAQRQKAVQAGQQGLMEEINAPALNSPHGYPAPVGMMTQPTYQQRLERLAVDDPEKALPLLGSYENKENSLDTRETIANLVYNAKLQQIEAANKRAEDLLNFRKNNVRDSKPSADSKEPDANKEQIRLKRAMDMASAYLAKKYTYDNLTGEYLDNGSPVPRKKINQEYIALVRQYDGKQTKSQAQPTTADPLGIR